MADQIPLFFAQGTRRFRFASDSIPDTPGDKTVIDTRIKRVSTDPDHLVIELCQQDGTGQQDLDIPPELIQVPWQKQAS